MSTEKSSSLNSFSSRLKFLRADRKKAEFARFIGVSPPLYHQWENGSTPMYDKALLISSKCGVTLEWLLSGEGPPGGIQGKTRNVRLGEDEPVSAPSACPECAVKSARIAELEAERDFLRDQVSGLVRAMALKPLPDADPACGASDEECDSKKGA